MDNVVIIGSVAMVTAGVTMAIGSISPALGEARALTQALSSLAQQPDASTLITRTLFVGMAMVETSVIFCFVLAMILLFANPFWIYVTERAAG